MDPTSPPDQLLCVMVKPGVSCFEPKFLWSVYCCTRSVRPFLKSVQIASASGSSAWEDKMRLWAQLLQSAVYRSVWCFKKNVCNVFFYRSGSFYIFIHSASVELTWGEAAHICVHQLLYSHNNYRSPYPLQPRGKQTKKGGGDGGR